MLSSLRIGGISDKNLTLSLVLLSGLLVGSVVGSIATSRYIDGDGGSNGGSRRRKKKGDEVDTFGHDEVLGGFVTGSGIKSRSLNDEPVVKKNNTTNTTMAGNVTSATFDHTITHVNFLSDIIARMWPYLNKGMSDMIRETVEPMFVDMMPKPLQNIKFVKIDLGTIPMILDNVIVHQLKQDPATKQDCIQFDWDVIWNSTCDIKLKGDYGVSFGVKSIKLIGRMTILLKPLSNVIPCIDAIQYSFINPPHLELDFTGLANVADFSIVDKTIRNIIQDVLASMIVLPLRMVYKMTPATNFGDIYTPIKGVARIFLKTGRGFVIEKHLVGKDDIPDVYCNIQLGCEKPIWRTTTIQDSLTPVWNDDEYHDFVVSDHDQIINVDVFDEDNGTFDADDYLGSAQVTVGQLLLASSKGMELPLVVKQKKGNDQLTGAHITLGMQIFPFTTTDHSSITSSSSSTSKEVTPPATPTRSKLRLSFKKNKEDRKQEVALKKQKHQPLVGLLTILVLQAYNVPLAKEDAETYVQVTYGENLKDDANKDLGKNATKTDDGPPTTFQTSVVVDYPGYDAINPVYEIPFHVPLSPDNINGDIKLKLINNRPDPSIKSKDNTTTILGEIVIKYDELLSAMKGTIQGKRPIGKDGAELEFSISLAGTSKSGGNMSIFATTKSGKAGDSKPRSIDTASDTTQSEASTAENSPHNMTAALSKERVRVAIERGHGFQVRKKKRMFKKDDIPDVYCIMKFGSMPQTFRTTTIKDSIEPSWDTTEEYQDYTLTSPNEVIHIDVYDENRKTKDDHFGTARISVGKVLLNGGSMDVEVMSGQNQKTGMFLTVQCFKI